MLWNSFPCFRTAKRGKSGKRRGLNCRLLEIDLKTDATREFVYRLESHHTKLSEILAVDDGKFLVIERDGETASEAAFKRIMAIDLKHATDTSRIESFPPKAVPTGVRPVKKTTFIDLARSSLRPGRPAMSRKTGRPRLGTLSAGRTRSAVDLRRQRLQAGLAEPVLCVCRAPLGRRDGTLKWPITKDARRSERRGNRD